MEDLLLAAGAGIAGVQACSMDSLLLLNEERLSSKAGVLASVGVGARELLREFSTEIRALLVERRMGSRAGEFIVGVQIGDEVDLDVFVMLDVWMGGGAFGRIILGVGFCGTDDSKKSRPLNASSVVGCAGASFAATGCDDTTVGTAG